MEKITKLDASVYKLFLTNELNDLIEIFKKHNYEIRVAGGAVRDLIMNIVPKDVDLATTATPDEMKIMFDAENIRMLNRNGEKHGTITARLADEINYEITTLRIDVATDGRHAEVQFTNDWRLDANRRDLTVNSLFLDFDGNVHDFFDGVEDIRKREIHFVGEPAKRIQEDYLRILRYFRFYGRICENEDRHDENALKAIRENAKGLEGVHGERIWVEFKQIVIGRYADSLVGKIVELDVHKHIGLPDKANVSEFSKVYARIKDARNQHELLPVTMIATLLTGQDEIEVFTKRVRLSNDEKKLGEFIIKYRDCDRDAAAAADVLKPYKNLLVDFIKDAKIYEKITQLLLYQGHIDHIEKIKEWTVPTFPVNGEMIAAIGVPKGPIFSKILNQIKEEWKTEHNFTANENILIKRATELFNESRK